MWCQKNNNKLFSSSRDLIRKNIFKIVHDRHHKSHSQSQLGIRLKWNQLKSQFVCYVVFYKFYFIFFGLVFMIFSNILSRHKTFSSLKKHFSTSKWHGFQSTSLDWHLKFLRLKGTPIYGRRELLNVTLTIRWQPFNSDLLLPPISTFLLFYLTNFLFTNFTRNIFAFWTHRQIKPELRK